VSETSQCTKIGENGEVITVSITTEESHHGAVLGNYESAQISRVVQNKENFPHEKKSQTHILFINIPLCVNI
jgi:hypothetical protein